MSSTPSDKAFDIINTITEAISRYERMHAETPPEVYISYNDWLTLTENGGGGTEVTVCNVPVRHTGLAVDGTALVPFRWKFYGKPN